jgi:hypothetical protein
MVWPHGHRVPPPGNGFPPSHRVVRTRGASARYPPGMPTTLHPVYIAVSGPRPKPERERSEPRG